MVGRNLFANSVVMSFNDCLISHCPRYQIGNKACFLVRVISVKTIADVLRSLWRDNVGSLERQLVTN
jgi:hypothetical protein